METYEIIPGDYTDPKDVKVAFTKTINITEQAYSEQDVLDTIAWIEAQKVQYCAERDTEIAINNEMLLKIRAIDRTINTVE